MTAPQETVLYADADLEAATTAMQALGRAGTQVRHVVDAAGALRELERDAVDVVVVDIDLPGKGGFELLALAAARWPDIPVILVAARATERDPVAAIRAGAADFLPKPFDAAELTLVVTKALSAVAGAVEEPPPPPSRVSPLGSPLVGESEALRDVLAVVRRAAGSTATVLVRGETGCGKELVARQVHALSPRAEQPFVKVHCAALPEPLLESELFGYEKGAFTGATARKLGRVELANHGTLFLDEIGDISPAIQVKLLRVLQDREYERVGGTQTLRADVRFVAATHRNLEAMVEQGRFREDLYYRLNVVPILVPPLRARATDIAPLARHFCATFGVQNGKPGVRFSDAAIARLVRCPWPGNVRQLQNFVERLVVFAEEAEIGEAAVQTELGELTESAKAVGLGDWTGAEPSMASGILELDAVLRHAERKALTKALARAGGNKTVAARILGVSRRTLYNKLEEHGMA